MAPKASTGLRLVHRNWLMRPRLQATFTVNEGFASQGLPKIHFKLNFVVSLAVSGADLLGQYPESDGHLGRSDSNVWCDNVTGHPVVASEPRH